MGMDVDYVVAKDEIKKLEKIVFDLNHGERESICDDIIEFVKLMEEKYGKGTGGS